MPEDHTANNSDNPSPSLNHKKVLSPSKELLDELAQQKTEPTLPASKPRATENDFSNFSSIPTRPESTYTSVTPDVSTSQTANSIYPAAGGRMNSSDETDPKTHFVSDKPISQLVPSLMILAIVSVLLQSYRLFISFSAYWQFHTIIGFSPKLFISYGIELVNVILCLYLLFSKSATAVYAILRFIVVLNILLLILLLLASRGINIIVIMYALYTGFLIHVKNTVKAIATS
jgi:hypothetical protein